MKTFITLLASIYFLSLVFWLRYLYLRSLRTAADRSYTAKKIAELIIYLPLGMQAAFLFPYALIQLFPLGAKTSRLFDRLILGSRATEFPELYPVKIIVTGSLIIGICYTLLKAISLLNDRTSEWLARALVFIGTLFMLKATVQNIYLSLHMGLVQDVRISYDQAFIWIFGLLLAIVLVIANRQDKESRRTGFLNYLTLTSRILLFYCVLLLLIGLPRMIYLVIEELFW